MQFTGMVSTKEIEDYVNGAIDEHKFLMQVTKDTKLDDLSLLSKVESVASSVNLRLRHEVGSNLGRLVEQAGSIDTLDSMQKLIHNEVRDATSEAVVLGKFVDNNMKAVNHSTVQLDRLDALITLLDDVADFENLTEKWSRVNFSEKADITIYLRHLLSVNTKVTELQIFQQKFKPIVDKESRLTRQCIVNELYKALEQRNYTTVKRAVFSLRALDGEFAENEFSRLYKRGIEELDLVFIALGSLESADDVVGALNQHRLKERLCDWFEKLRMIDIELLSRFADRLGQIINIRMSNASPSVIYILRILHSCANEQVSVVSKPIKNALIALDTSYLNHCYDRLTKVVDDVFADKNTLRDSGKRNIQGAFDLIIDEAKFDRRLEDLVRKRVSQALYYTVQQADMMLNNIPQDYRFGRRVTNNQQMTYAILNLLYTLAIKYDCKMNIPAFLESHRLAIMNSIFDTTRLVLGAMYDEFETNRKLKDDIVSPYMMELCSHLTTFGIHFDQLACYSSQTVPGVQFGSYIFDAFLVHISLLRPFDEVTTRRCSMDCKYLMNTLFKVIKNPVASHNLKTKQLFSNFLKELPGSLQTASTLAYVPPWFICNVVVALTPEIPTPYDSVNWTRQKYTEWFCGASDADRHQFLKTLLISFEKLAKTSSPYYDLAIGVVQKWEANLKT